MAHGMHSVRAMRILLPLLLAALPAFSTTITYDHSLPRLYEPIEVSLAGAVMTVNAGQIAVQFDDTIPALMYCADPVTWLLPGPVPVTAVSDSVFPNGARLAWLYNTYNATLTEGWEAAALQLAFWEIVLDNNDDNLNSGQTRVTSNTNPFVAALAGAMLLASAGQGSSGVTFWVPDQGPGYSQTLLTASAAAVTATPEPAGYLLFGAGLLFLGALRRR